MTDELEPQLPLDLQPKPTIVYQAHAFSSFNEVVEAPQGRTVAEMVASLGFPADYDDYIHVWINDLPLEREMWEHLIPSAGQMVYVRIIPQGGEDGGKDILRTIAQIAITVVAMYYAPALLGYEAGAAGWAAASNAGFSASLAVASVSAAITIAGNMALNAIIPPPKLELDLGGGLGSQKNQLTGSSNRFAPYAPIPRVFGKRRLYPLLAGRPYSETQGDDEYLRMALVVGWGPLRITDIKIGETPITSFSEVEYEVREGWSNDTPLTKYTSTITENNYSILLAPAVDGNYTYSTRTSEAGVTEISVDVTAPSGVAKFESNGSRSSIDVDVRVEVSLAGTNNWESPTWLNSTDPGLNENGRIRFSGADTSTLRRTGRFAVPAGQYDVRLYRTTSEYDTTKHTQEVRWTIMRNVKPSYPVQQKNVALIALRIKATNQLNGVPQQISCVAESYLPVYDGSTWSYQITRNPAWAFADVLRRRAGETYLSDSRIDLTTIQSWAAACDATAPNASEPYWQFDGVIEGGTVFQVLRQIASSARANYTIRDGKHSVVRDIAQTVPAQHITPRNSYGYSGSKVFLDYPHAMRVVFVNAAKNYEEDERIVYDDGYSAGTATKFETLELYGCTSADQAFREGRYFIAASRLRPETHTVQMDIENLRCTIGDLVRFSHDVVSIGITSGRVVSVDGTTIVLDQEVPFTTGQSFGLRVRLSDGNYVIVTLQNPGDVTTATLTATSSTSGIAAGDLAMFGNTSSVTVPMLVKKIEPGPDFTAKLHLVDAQAGVWTADTGAIPAFNSNITTTEPLDNQRPNAPTIFSVRSDDVVALLLADGTVQVRMAVTVTPPASGLLRIDYYDVQWRGSTGVNWTEERYARGTPIFLSPVQVGVSYQIRVRAVSEYGVAGEWSTVTTHTVAGKNNPPGDVAGLDAVIKPGLVDISWTAATDADYDVTEIRVGASWSAGTPLWKGAGTSYPWPRPVNGNYTIWAKHLDTSGNYSANAASKAVSVTDSIEPAGKQTVVVTLYQWSTAQPGDPNGQTTYTWASASHTGYTGGNDWSTVVPANPGTAGLKLWVATKSITGYTSDVATTVSWGSGFTVAVWSQNGASGANGIQSATPTVYQWAASIPSGPSGTATYTWSSGDFGAAPSGWSLTPGTSPSAGYTLWGATVTVTDTAVNLGTNFNWATASITARGYAGTNGGNGATGAQGASSRLAYARIANNPSPISGTITVSGDNVPGQTASNSVWGLNVAWTTTDPNPSSTNTLYVTDGIYDPATGNTVWSTPYIASLKVGTLSAITVNTGDLTVNGTLIVSSGGMVRSSNYVAGTSGWKIDDTGAEFPAAAITSGTIANARIGDLAAKRIYTGPANAVTFVDAADPALNPFNSTASGYLLYSGDTATATLVSQTCYDGGYTRDCSYYVYNAYVVTGSSVTFEMGNGNVPQNRRIKSGNVRFTVICTATVDHYLSIWYRKWNGSSWGGWACLATAVEPQSNYGAVSVVTDVTLNANFTEAFQFGMSATNSNLNYWNSDRRNIAPGHLVVFAQNF